MDLYGISSATATTLSIQLVCSNVERADGFVTLFKRTVALTPKSVAEPVTLTLGIASGWLAKYWVLFAHIDQPGDVVEFGARYTLDRAGAGLYTAFGDGTSP